MIMQIWIGSLILHHCDVKIGVSIYAQVTMDKLKAMCIATVEHMVSAKIS